MSEGLAAPSAPSESADTSPDVSRETDESNEKEERAEPKKEAKPKQPPKMRKVKVDGKEEFVDEDSVWRDYQKYRAGEKRLQEAAKLRQEAEERMAKLKDDPYSVLSELGLDPSELSENWLRKKLEEELDFDPRDKEMRELQKRLSEYESKEQRAKEEQEMTAREKFVESRKEALSKTLAEAMESTLLSKHPETSAALLREMAMYMRTAKENGEDVSPQELAQFVENNRFKQYHMLANQFEGEQLIEFLGKDIVNKIRKADLERLRGKKAATTQSWKTEQPVVDKQKSKFINPSDFRFALRNME
jgi:hypothetical protein